jgi:hypothetical protein
LEDVLAETNKITLEVIKLLQEEYLAHMLSAGNEMRLS